MKTKVTLDKKSINKAISELVSEMEKVGGIRNDCLRFRLSLEEILLSYNTEFGEKALVRIITQRKKDNLFIRIILQGKKFNPILDTDSLILIKTIHNWDNAPTYHYEARGEGVNTVTYSFKVHGSLKDNLEFTWGYAKESKAVLSLAIFLQFVCVAFMIIGPILSARIIVAFTNVIADQIILTALSLFAVNMASAGVLSGCNWAYNTAYNKTLTLVETDIAKNVLKLENKALDESGTGLFIQRLTVDTANLASAFSTFFDNLSQACYYLGILFAMLIVSPTIFVLAAILLAIQTLTQLKKQDAAKGKSRIYRNNAERYSGIVGEMVRGCKDIKMINAQEEFESELQVRVKDANDSRMKVDASNRKYSFIHSTVRQIGGLIFIALLTTALLKGRISVAIAIVLYNYYSQLGTSASDLLGAVLDFVTQFNLSCERLKDIMDDSIFAKEVFGNVHKDVITGEIEFKKVSFSYNIGKLNTSTRWVLRNLNFKVAAGETVAIVGRSGSGKTTIMNLIGRLYDPFTGMVTIDGVNSMDLDMASLRGSMSVVTQDPYIFKMSIRDNLRIAKPDMTEEEMKAVAAYACIDEDIEAKPEKYDTVVGEGGVSLSGGQRQRIAIARALLRKPRILLLDEATSALDNVTQDRIRESLERIKGKCTIIIVAHRLSTIVNADRILYLQDGRILAQGKHNELLANCPEYRELYEIEDQNSGGQTL